MRETGPFKRLMESLRLGANPADLARATQLWKEGSAIARPVSWHGVLPLAVFLDRFKPYAGQSALVSSRLANAEKVVLIVATIGIEVEQRAGNFRERGEGIKGQVLDTMGSGLVEAELRRVHVQLSFQWGRRGYSITPRFSPGEGDFAAAAESVFAELIDPSELKLSVTADRRLSPEKTRIAIMGLIRDQS
jgi:hypothetical protein